MEWTIGDVLWQLFFLGLLILLVVMIVKIIRFFQMHTKGVSGVEKKTGEFEERVHNDKK
ncbi:hypothetical protein ACIQXQ_12555 [Peribacillus sp. NPDC097198]|uniref:hypothetical protein n=1 Tax=Peribacillus sp. NPDC097198 TaxID=3364397 RepID=UPI0037F9FBE4